MVRKFYVRYSQCRIEKGMLYAGAVCYPVYTALKDGFYENLTVYFVVNKAGQLTACAFAK